MEIATNSTLLDVMESCRVRRFSGAVQFRTAELLLKIWFVRGSLAHAMNSAGESGWTALESLKAEVNLAVQELADELPPQRTIRVDTFRLIKAMKSSFKSKRPAPMHVPMPLHARLQQKFNELSQKVTGLKSFETVNLDAQLSSNQGKSHDFTGKNDASSADRTIMERDPRGAKWIHRTANHQLTVQGDESITTTELMWVGSELWRELDRLRQRTLDNEQ